MTIAQWNVQCAKKKQIQPKNFLSGTEQLQTEDRMETENNVTREVENYPGKHIRRNVETSNGMKYIMRTQG